MSTFLHMTNENVFTTPDPKGNPRWIRTPTPFHWNHMTTGLNTSAKEWPLPEKVLTTTEEDPIRDLPSVFHTTYFTGASTSLLHGEHVWLLTILVSSHTCSLRPGLTRETTQTPILYPGRLPDYFLQFDARQSQAVSMWLAGQKQENQCILRNPVTKNKKHTNTNHAPLKLHICITL